MADSCVKRGTEVSFRPEIWDALVEVGAVRGQKPEEYIEAIVNHTLEPMTTSLKEDKRRRREELKRNPEPVSTEMLSTIKSFPKYREYSNIELVCERERLEFETRQRQQDSPQQHFWNRLMLEEINQVLCERDLLTGEHEYYPTRKYKNVLKLKSMKW